MSFTKKPHIGIVTSTEYFTRDNLLSMKRQYVNNKYIEAVIKSGGIPYLLPILDDIDDIYSQINNIEGIMLTGGCDINSLLYCEEPDVNQGVVDFERDIYEIKLIRRAYEIKKPIFGICRGMQVINVAYGGTLYQNISSIYDYSINHNQICNRNIGTHTVIIEKDTMLYSIFEQNIITNSMHHQALKKVAPDFRISAKSKDNIIEAIECRNDELFILGVQWHPEEMFLENDKMLFLFKKFINACIAFS